MTERKIDSDGPGGPTAYLFQRMFIIVREPEKTVPDTTTATVDGRRLDLAMPLATVRIVTRVTPHARRAARARHRAGPATLFEPERARRAVPVQARRDRPREQHRRVLRAARVHGARLEPPLAPRERRSTAYNAEHPRAPRMDRQRPEGRVRGQRAAGRHDPGDGVADFRRRDGAVPEATGSQDDPRFKPVLREAKAVVPAMSALAGAASAVGLGYPHVLRRRKASPATPRRCSSRRVDTRRR